MGGSKSELGHLNHVNAALYLEPFYSSNIIMEGSLEYVKFFINKCYRSYHK